MSVPQPLVKPSEPPVEPATGRRLSGDYFVQRALEKLDAGDFARKDGGAWVACQLRDEGWTRDEALPFMLDYQARTPQDSHPYTEQEARATLCSIYNRPPREPASRFLTDDNELDELDELDDSSDETSKMGTAKNMETTPAAFDDATEADNEKVARREEAKRKRARTTIKKMIGVPIQRVIRFGAQSAYYEIELADGRRFPLGTNRDYRSAARFADALIDAGYNISARIPKGGWADMLDNLLIITETIPTEGENEETLDWLFEIALRWSGGKMDWPDERYATIRQLTEDTSTRAYGRDREGRMYFRSAALVDWLQELKMKIFTRQAIAKRLHKVGFVGGDADHQITASHTDEGGTHQVKCRVWISPPGFLHGVEHRYSEWQAHTSEETQEDERTARSRRKREAIRMHHQTRYEG